MKGGIDKIGPRGAQCLINETEKASIKRNTLRRGDFEFSDSCKDLFETFTNLGKCYCRDIG